MNKVKIFKRVNQNDTKSQKPDYTIHSLLFITLLLKLVNEYQLFQACK